MRKILSVFFIVLLFCFFSACEKDDICVGGDTPLLVIGFFDIEDQELPKPVPALRIRAFGQDPIDNTENTIFFSDRTSQDSVGIPLRVDSTATQYEFIFNSADNENMMETGTIDTLSFTYENLERFDSRGCGFVVNYIDLDTMRNVFGSDWIKRIEVIDTAIENSSNIHVKIFH